MTESALFCMNPRVSVKGQANQTESITITWSTVFRVVLNTVLTVFTALTDRVYRVDRID